MKRRLPTTRSKTRRLDPSSSSADQQQQQKSNDGSFPPILLPYPHWHNVLAGAVAGATARLATAPLDLLRIRAQLEREVTYPRPSLWKKLRTIYQQEGGVGALFRGNLAATYLWIGYSAVQFSVYGSIKQELYDIQQQQQLTGSIASDESYSLLDPYVWLSSTSIAFMSGAGAGICATISTYPFDICRTVFAAQGLSTTIASTSSTTTSTTFQSPRSLWECASRMYHQSPSSGGYGGGGGIRAFFVGLKPAIVQIVPYMGLNFAIYDSLTQGDRRIGLSGYAGSISGAVSKIVVYPCDTIKKRIQYQSVFGASTSTTANYYYKGMWDCFVTMIRTEGISSLYRGLVPSVLKTAIGSGLSFTFFRMTKNGLEELHDYQNNNNSSSDIGRRRRQDTKDSNVGIA